MNLDLMVVRYFLVNELAVRLGLLEGLLLWRWHDKLSLVLAYCWFLLVVGVLCENEV